MGARRPSGGKRSGEKQMPRTVVEQGGYFSLGIENARIANEDIGQNLEKPSEALYFLIEDICTTIACVYTPGVAGERVWPVIVESKSVIPTRTTFPS